jgi:hypothetical protein
MDRRVFLVCLVSILVSTANGQSETITGRGSTSAAPLYAEWYVNKDFERRIVDRVGDRIE